MSVGNEMAAAMHSAELMSLPGFRFSPLEHELVGFYLKMMVEGKNLGADFIGTVDLYKHDPRELPALAVMGEREWYFFVPRDRKYPNGSRPNRVTKSGYWKATGTDRAVASMADYVGLRKTLVFYEGKAPRGVKTPWIMNEYRLQYVEAESSRVKNDVTLCKIYRKGTTRGYGSYLMEDIGGTLPSPPPPNDQKSASSGAPVSSARGEDSPVFDSETSPPQPHPAESPPIVRGNDRAASSASSPESESNDITPMTGNGFPKEMPGLADQRHPRGMDTFQSTENVMFSGFEDITMSELDRQLEEQLQVQLQQHRHSRAGGGGADVENRKSSWFRLARLDWSEPELNI